MNEPSWGGHTHRKPGRRELHCSSLTLCFVLCLPRLFASCSLRRKIGLLLFVLGLLSLLLPQLLLLLLGSGVSVMCDTPSYVMLTAS